MDKRVTGIYMNMLHTSQHQQQQQLPQHAQQHAAIPEGFGTAIPSNPAELMKFLQQQRQTQTQTQSQTLSQRTSAADVKKLQLLQPGTAVSQPHFASLSLSEERLKKQEQERENYECRLMQLEDYIFTVEGVERIKRIENRLRMETEDELSTQLKIIFKDHDKERLREKIRREVEARKIAELAEREARRKAAEERRAAVVERLRKQQELEEQRKRDAELARIRIIEEQARKEQEERDKLISDQTAMTMEDQLSSLAEQEYREHLERKAWQQREKERLMLWEQEQKRKDAIEEEQRKLRMADLDEKKRKLELLRQQQQAQNATTAAATAQAMKEEGERINKQLRIQNRAKFVSKKITAVAPVAPPAPEPSVVEVKVVTPRDLEKLLNIVPESSPTKVLTRQMSRKLSMKNMDGIIFNQQPATASSQTQVLGDSTITPTVLGRVPSMNPAEVQKFQLKVHEISSDATLKDLQKELMQEKRGLRLEQRQKASFLEVDGQDPNGEEDFALLQKLHEIDVKHDIVEQRLNKLITQVADNAVDESNDVAGPIQVPANAKQGKVLHAVMSRGNVHNKSQKIQIQPSINEQTSENIPLKLGSTHNLATASTPDHTDLFKKIELTLRNSNKLLCTIDNIDNPSRQLTLLSLEISQLIKEVNPDFDPLGYKEKLLDMSQRMKAGSEELDRKQKEIAQTKRASSRPITPIITQRSLTPRIVSPRGLELEQPLLSSISAPVIQNLPAESEISSKVETDIIINSTKEAEVNNEDEIINPEMLSGWEDCIYTSMFSAAHHAAYFGFTDVLKFLVKFFDCFIMDKKCRTPLFYACLANNLDCVAILLELGPDWIDVGDEKGDTPLHAAAISNSIKVLAFLLSCEAHPDTANNMGKTPSHLARSEEGLNILHQSNATLFCVDNSNHMPLWYACAENRPDCVKYLCSQTPKEYLLWQDDEGDSCLHKASSAGHGNIVEILCQYVPKIEDLYVVNKRHYSPAHVAANSSVLRALYENGANLWILDSKLHMPLFLASFHGRADCVGFLLDIGTKLSAKQQRPPSGGKSNTRSHNNIHEGILVKDKQGDTALHVAAVCGHIACVSLLIFYIRNEKNNQQLTPSLLAKRAGHTSIYTLIEYYDNFRSSNPQLSPHDIFLTDFSTLYSMVAYYGSRWCIGYDSNFDTIYYFDYCTGCSQWNKPESFDMKPNEETKYLKALDIIKKFYHKYNPEKMKDIHSILAAFHCKYTDLFIMLANRYNVQDLSMFQGVDFD